MISKSRYNRIKARIDRIETQLDKVYDAIDRAYENGHVASYSFDSGEGSQQTTYRSLTDLEKIRDRLESKVDRLYRKLEGTGLKNINVRRKGGSAWGHR